METVIRAVLAVLGVSLVAAGCGGSSAAPLSFDAPLTSEVDDPVAPTEATDGVTTAPGATASSTTSPPVVAATSWVPAAGSLEGLPSECGNLSFVSARDDRDVVIAGVALQGLWASTGGSDTWVQLGTDPGSDDIINRPTSIVYDAEHPETFWESGSYGGGGVYQTTDDGASFEQLGDVIHSDLISVDFSDPLRRTLMSGTHEQQTIYRSTDGGSTWTDVTAGLPEGIGFALPHVIDAETHLVGTRGSAGSGVFRTTDGGSTWQQVHSAGVNGRPLVSPDAAILWLTEDGGLIRSTDGGLTWSEPSGQGTIAAGANVLLGLPDGRLATIGNGHVVVSADDGATWSNIGARFPYDPMGLAYAPFRDAFYIWRFECDFTTDNPIDADSIMRLALEPAG